MITILSGFCFFYNAYLIFQWDYKITIIYCCVSSFTIMVHRLLKSRSLSQYCCFNIFESLLLISYLLSIVYYIEIEKVNINFISYAQLVLQFLILAITVLINKSTSETESQDQSLQIQEILISAFKSISALQLVFISLRITEQITWGWIQTLIIIWFLLGLSFVIFICLLVDILQKCRNQQDGIEEEKKRVISKNPLYYLVQGGIWLNLILFGITILPFSTIFGLALSYDFKFKSLNQYAFGLTIFYYLLQLAYYFKFKQKLIDYLLYYDIAQSNLYVDQQLQQVNQNNQQIENRIELKMKRMHKLSISKVPQFMVKLSQTYYKCALNADSQCMSSKIQQNQLNQKNQFQENENDNEQSKRFDLLLSSPRQRLEISSSIGQDLTSRNIDKKQLEDQSTIKQEQQNQNSQKLCLVCYEKESNMINMPCGHGGFCNECCEQLLSKSELCYLCRKPVTHSLQIQEVQNRESLVEVVEVLEQQNK
ncbi:unnamed protein product (macronuclear) [Paramecium tetraurelia]|uniref:RING-type domain-containing protein n=1 Tax=Paramecium tetraurelia TaxID=5888 RepID=A0D3H9_PARTE|nr:uncharacterized protein GSPATT00013084001 [Paramecium tetraurelia]CAK77596.1 unnamed protein product [Paramecium tetraurelia]|eukprot:XP_001444993.1 hypothetical protein (macronuclear) [Paramecium tetraurelia strain d4-2]